MIRIPGDPTPSAPAPSRPTLADLEHGQVARVVEIGGDAAIRLRLLELGFLPGSPVRLVRRAPLGCPVEVDLDGTRFGLRLETARAIQLELHG